MAVDANTRRRAKRVGPAYQATARAYRQRVKAEVISLYGGHCGCCGESHLAFLTLDHIDGGGREHRREIGAGYGFYLWVRKTRPGGLRVLCLNCNFAEHHEPGGCPHGSMMARRIQAAGAWPS